MGRNKIIEVYRLFFTVLIVLSHMDSKIGIFNENKLFLSAWLAVEFFFILSGFLMSKSIYAKNVLLPDTLGTETIQFLCHKVKPIYPVYLFAFLAENIMEKIAGIDTGAFIYKIWDLTFLKITGLQGEFLDMAVGASWFLSALFVAVMILYPIARAFPNMFIHVLSPLIAVFILGFMSNVYGKCLFALSFENGISLGLLRAIAGLCLGSTSFALYRSINSSGHPWFDSFNKKGGLFFAQLVSLAVILWIMISFGTSQMNFICIFFFTLLVTFAFSDQSNISKVITWKLKVDWIAMFSVSLYLNHVIWIRLLSKWRPLLNLPERYAFVLLLSVALAIVCVNTISLVKALINNKNDYESSDSKI